MIINWDKSRWRSFPITQQPVWGDATAYLDVMKQLNSLPALVFAGESRTLKRELAEAALGRAFVLQAGDCAETFVQCHGPTIHNLLKVILQMAVILTYAGEKKVVKIGRIAGQYAKPRSTDYEIIDGDRIQAYRGDMVNSAEPSLAARIPNPRRML